MHHRDHLVAILHRELRGGEVHCAARLVALLPEDATPDDDWTCANWGENRPSATLLRNIFPDDDEKD
jgi:hypothetical protein